MDVLLEKKLEDFTIFWGALSGLRTWCMVKKPGSSVGSSSCNAKKSKNPKELAGLVAKKTQKKRPRLTMTEVSGSLSESSPAEEPRVPGGTVRRRSSHG